jgi:WbqC-like protein
MIVAAHQPHFLPWTGYLAKVLAADLFVVMDDLQYEAQNFQNRNRIKLNHGAAWLTVPLQRGPQSERVCDKRINNQGSPKEHWQRRSFETLKVHYRGAPHWARYEAELADVFGRPWERLVDLDLHMLKLHLGWLDIKKPVLLSSSLGLSGQKTDRIQSLCRAVGAGTYLSGGGGSRGYLDVEQLERAGIGTVWQSFRHPVYPQRYPQHGFVSHLGALDLVLNCGPDSARILRESIVVAPAHSPAAASESLQHPHHSLQDQPLLQAVR